MDCINKVHKKVPRINKIIQFGEGAFLRGFADWIVQILNERTDFCADITVVQPIENGLCDKLEAQDCLYTHIARGISGGKPVAQKKVIDVISKTVQPYRDFNAYLALAQEPDYRFIVSNTTESGIAFNPADTPDKAPNITFPAKVTLLLEKRFSLGLGGFIFLPCELIEKNGETLKKYIKDYAALWGYGRDFINWIENENIFCNTLVDRIVTGNPGDEVLELGYEDAMVNTSELFHLWVIEGPERIKREIPLSEAGLNIIVADNLDKYRTRKVRILNGAHTAMIPYAMLRGIETVGDCMKDKSTLEFIKKCVYDEIIPTLDLPEAELIDYADSVFERFRNPYIRHLCSAISLNSVSKFKVRVLPSITEYIKIKKQVPQHLIFSFAKLIEFYRSDMPNDDPEVIRRMRSDLSSVLSDRALWGMDLSFLKDEIAGRINQ